MEYGFLAIWQFRVLPGNEETFERIYGPEGEWAQLFRSGEGYLGTALNRSLADPQVYLTLDFWSSEQAYDRFRKANEGAYKQIDQRCQALTGDEKEVGRYTAVRSAHLP